RAGQAERGRVDGDVGFAVHVGGGVVENLRLRAELHVHLDPENRIVTFDRVVKVNCGHFASLRSGADSQIGPPPALIRASIAAAKEYIRASSRAGAMTCRPTGSPSAIPLGRESAGSPARLTGIVAKSPRYIASGSSTRSPSLNAVVAAVGETSTSTFAKASAKSRCTRVRTRWALP